MCLVPTRLSVDENLRVKEGEKLRRKRVSLLSLSAWSP